MKNQIATLFVAFSHNLTQSQIKGFENQFGFHLPEGRDQCENCGGYPCDEDICGHHNYTSHYVMVAKFVTLKEVNPELQAQMSNIPATATIVEIQELAKAIVAEAVKCGVTHFFCTGEPTLTMWANLYANGYIFDVVQKAGGLKCIQSTTERKSVEVTNPDGLVTKTAVFQHVQWRKMF